MPSARDLNPGNRPPAATRHAGCGITSLPRSAPCSERPYLLNPKRFDKETILTKIRIVSRVTSKLQVTLPKAIADAHNIRSGSEIQFESGIDCVRIVVGKSGSELSLEEKLRLLKEARIRQQLRNKKFRHPTKPVRRGWRRDDLYERGTTR